MDSLQKIVKTAKAGEIRELYENLVTKLRLKFNRNTEFFFRCLGVYCKSLKRDKLAKHTNLFEILEKCRERHKKLECIISKRFQDLKKSLMNKGEYHIQLRNYVKLHSKEIKKYEDICIYFPTFMKNWIFYQVDTEILESQGLVNHFFKENISKEFVIQEPILERTLITILQEKKEWSNKLREQNLIFKDFLKLISEEYTDMLSLEFHKNQKQRYSYFVKEETVEVEHFGDIRKNESMNQHLKEADALRETSFFKDIFKNTNFNVENETFFQKIEWSPLMFQEIYEKKAKQINMISSCIRNKENLQNLYQSQLISKRKRHLVVLVHGYGGSHFDMSNYKNFLNMIIPHSVFLSSKSNEEMENKKISVMGKSLADEVIGAIKGSSNIGKVSFIGHSLGGVIARAALPHLKEFQKLMFTFVSLSSPHLGTVKNSSFLVNTGMFFLDKFKKDSVVIELLMNDEKDPRKSFMYSLAAEDKLHWFSNVILLSSPQDSFVPYNSARIQPTKPSAQSKTAKVLQEMSNNIWKNVSSDMIVRVDVDLRSPERFYFFSIIF